MTPRWKAGWKQRRPRQGEGGLRPVPAGAEVYVGLIALGQAALRDVAAPAAARVQAMAGGLARALRVRWANEVWFLKHINRTNP